MKYYPFSLPRLLTGFSFLLFALSINSPAQRRTEPDEQILRQMTEYVIDLQIKAAGAAAPRNHSPRTPSGGLPAAQKASYRRGETPVPVWYNTASAAASAYAALERRAFGILNEQRASKGLPPLRWSEDLARVARLHSENMARHKFFSHTGRDGLSVQHRARQLGVRGWRGIGENIAFNQGFSKPVEMACQHWMTSRGHRENILNRNYTESGIGVAVAPDGGYFFTQVFVIK